jgi:hypothetical protein
MKNGSIKEIVIGIDINTISDFQYDENNILLPAEILKMANETGILIYRGDKGNKPIKFTRPCKFKITDVNTKRGQRIAKKLIENYGK